MDSHQLINQNSEDVEYYTPGRYVDPARYLVGGCFDLDAASCPTANRVIRARHIYTIADNGLVLPWFGNVWMNHPFGKPENACGPNCKKKTCQKRGHCLTEDRPGNADWINKLVSEYESGRVHSAVCICFAAVNAKWFAPLLEYPQFFPTGGRVNYCRPDGAIAEGVTKDSVITFFPPNNGRWVYTEETKILQDVYNGFGVVGKAK